MLSRITWQISNPWNLSGDDPRISFGLWVTDRNSAHWSYTNEQAYSHTEFKFSKICAKSVSFFHIFFSLKNWFMEFHNWTDWAPISLRLKFWGISRFTSLWRFVRIPGIAWSTSWEPKSSHFRGDYSLIMPSKILTALSIPPTSQDNLTSLIWPSNLGWPTNIA